MLRTKKLFCVLFPYIYILNGYASGIKGLSLGSILAGIMDFMAVIYVMKNKTIRKRNLVLFFLYLIFIYITFINVLRINYININNFFIYILKTSIFIISVTFLADNFFDAKMIFKYYLYMSFIATCYLYIQSVFWYSTKTFLPNLFNFGFIRPLYEVYASNSYASYVSRLNMARPASFFSEPSFYGDICVISLAILFYQYNLNLRCNNYNDSKKIYYALFYFIGVILSTSTGGILLSIILFAGHIIIQSNMKFLRIIFAIIIFLVLCLLILFISKNFIPDVYDFTYSKIMNMDKSSRIGKSFEKITLLSGYNLFLGLGAGGEDYLMEHGYNNSLVIIMFNFGIVGMICLFYTFIYYLTKIKNSYSRLILLLYFIKTAQSGSLYNLYGILYIITAKLFDNYYKNVNFYL